MVGSITIKPSVMCSTGCVYLFKQTQVTFDTNKWIRETSDSSSVPLWPTALRHQHSLLDQLQLKVTSGEEPLWLTFDTFSCLLWGYGFKIDTKSRHKQSFVCCLFFNEPLCFPFFSFSSACSPPNSLVPPLPLPASSTACDKLWITHYTFRTDRLCMSTFIYILLITSAMFINESQCWATPTILSDGHGDPKCPWYVATIRLLGK